MTVELQKCATMRKCVSILALFAILSSSFGQTGIPKAQAMFIYNFSRLIEWPSNYKTGPFVIGVYGSATVYNEISNYSKNKRVGSQAIEVKKINSPAEIGNCHILFIPFSKTKQMGEIVGSLNGKSTLIIGEKNGAIDSGASINFVIVGDKLKFEIKPSNATNRNIKMSSKLGEMAFKVH